MLVRYTFNITTGLSLTDWWPIRWQGLEFIFVPDGEVVTKLQVMVREDDKSKWPKITKDPKPGVKAHINFGHSDWDEKVESLVRAIQGLVGIYRHIEIDIANPKMEWIPENDQERESLHVTSFEKQKPHDEPLPPLPFDLVARSILCAEKTLEIEIPLNFYRRGVQDVFRHQYVEAFYDFFFFIETLFGNGKSRERALQAEFEKSPILLAAIEEAREDFIRHYKKKSTDFAKFIFTEPNPKNILKKIIKKRGFLHHHTSKRKNTWHPERQAEFEAEAGYLQGVCMRVALGLVGPHVFTPEAEREYFEMSKTVGAIQTLRYVFSLAKLGGVQVHDQVFNINVPGTKITHDMLATSDIHFRQQFNQICPDDILVGYRCQSEDGQEIYSEFRNLFPIPSQR